MDFYITPGIVDDDDGDESSIGCASALVICMQNHKPLISLYWK